MQEHAVCKTSPDSPVGTIEVSYTANNCCIDASEWSPAGTNFLEPETCSSRTCVSGRPAQWERKTEFQGGCGCCVHDGALVTPGDCRTLTDGRNACCCDGEMVVKVEETEPEVLTV